MQTRKLRRSGIEVSVVGLGTWQVLDVREREEEEARHEIVCAALYSGVTLFDSSPMYGRPERVLGDALRKHGRERASAATKVWTSDDREAERRIKDTLSFFGGHVELYQSHDLVAVEKRLDMLEELKSEGKVCCIGATHYSRSAFPALMDVPYNAADVVVTEEVLPLAEEPELDVIAMVPLGSGRLVRNSPSKKELEEDTDSIEISAFV